MYTRAFTCTKSVEWIRLSNKIWKKFYLEEILSPKFSDKSFALTFSSHIENQSYARYYQICPNILYSQLLNAKFCNDFLEEIRLSNSLCRSLFERRAKVFNPSIKSKWWSCNMEISELINEIVYKNAVKF